MWGLALFDTKGKNQIIGRLLYLCFPVEQGPKVLTNPMVRWASPHRHSCSEMFSRNGWSVCGAFLPYLQRYWHTPLCPPTSSTRVSKYPCTVWKLFLIDVRLQLLASSSAGGLFGGLMVWTGLMALESSEEWCSSVRAVDESIVSTLVWPKTSFPFESPTSPSAAAFVVVPWASPSPRSDSTTGASCSSLASVWW